MILGITGHQKLQDFEAWNWVTAVLQSILAEVASPLIGFSSLAIGADQLFAELVLEHGGELRVILPFATYEKTLNPGRDLETYRTLLNRAAAIEILSECSTKEESYLVAGQRVVDLAERMVAVWNGKEAVGLGGTGDVVRYALTSGKDVFHINPISREVRTISGSQ
ncbi:MAG TPA: hypothetical protein VLB76_22300 [Thermoanaerobaculia bacterium]|jgi:hypothetical protein|nr:hypothetical protein [Thermoanaerobaculia bacterium]